MLFLLLSGFLLHEEKKRRRKGKKEKSRDQAGEALEEKTKAPLHRIYGFCWLVAGLWFSMLPYFLLKTLKEPSYISYSCADLC